MKGAPVDDRVGVEDPEKSLGCLIKLKVVAYFVQPHRGDKGQEVRDDESDGDDDAESELIFGITNAEFLDPFPELKHFSAMLAE